MASMVLSGDLAETAPARRVDQQVDRMVGIVEAPLRPAHGRRPE